MAGGIAEELSRAASMSGKNDCLLVKVSDLGRRLAHERVDDVCFWSLVEDFVDVDEAGVELQSVKLGVVGNGDWQIVIRIKP